MTLLPKHKLLFKFWLPDFAIALKKLKPMNSLFSIFKNLHRVFAFKVTSTWAIPNLELKGIKPASIQLKLSFEAKIFEPIPFEGCQREGFPSQPANCSSLISYSSVKTKVIDTNAHIPIAK